jgi:UDP-N-acetylglucosamine diphosphorylase / glucose-1-phosphate thymidylyltransferase / UDP-N-acetylgalactosamine diphosphorylase / glucosamine-1-phosphate N-acetyltransferase / galactosamine-1-phosphate N-acetyltransferase
MPLPHPTLALSDYVASWLASPLAAWSAANAWEITCQSEAVVRQLLATLPPGQYHVTDEIAVHHSTVVESGAVLKGPLIIGAHGLVAAGAYVRGGNWLDQRCIIGPGCEIKSSFVFAGTKLAHFNFVGDSIVGADVNLEAGSIVCNYRNERADKQVRVRVGTDLHPTGQTKFGALIGDHTRVGANAVLAPGCLLRPGSVVPRLALRDDEQD